MPKLAFSSDFLNIYYNINVNFVSAFISESHCTVTENTGLEEEKNSFQ